MGPPVPGYLLDRILVLRRFEDVRAYLRPAREPEQTVRGRRDNRHLLLLTGKFPMFY